MTSAEALEAALDLLATDQIAAYVAIGDALQDLVVDCLVDGEGFHVVGGAELMVRRGAAGDAAVVWVVSSRAAILALADGEIGVLGAVRARWLDVRTDISLMVRVSRAQRAFAEGAARSRAMREVLARYREGASEAA